MSRHEERYFGTHGGRYIPEVLRPAFVELEQAWKEAKEDPRFWEEFQRLASSYVGRPTPLYFAERLTEHFCGPQIFLKLEGLAHTGAHKINNALGQGLLARRMGKTRLIAETGAGQHGIATAAIAAKMGFECEVFMGEVDIARQHPNVFGMRMYGAKVTPVTEGTKTLTDAVNAALKNWTERVADTHYLMGSALGPYPYPEMVREFQSAIGKETRRQLADFGVGTPDRIYACVGGGSNSIGMFSPFLDSSAELVGVEAAGLGIDSGKHAVRMNGGGKQGIVQAYKSYFLQDDNGSLRPTHSISAGLDYAGIGPQLAYLGDQKRIRFVEATDRETLDALLLTARLEGILPALESSHALAGAFREMAQLSKEQTVVINISGRGDKDLFITAPEFDREDWIAFLQSELNRLQGEQR